MPAIYRFGTHTEVLLQDAASKASVVFKAAPAAAAPVTQPLLPAAQYMDAGHRLAILQQSAAQACVVFQNYWVGTLQVLTVQRGFNLIEQDPGPLFAPQSMVFATPVAFIAPPPAATPLFGLIPANPQPFAPDWYTPQSSVFTPTAALIPPIIPIIRVMATAIGEYGNVIFQPGDVFDIEVQDFSDSSIDYLSGNPGSPLFGWMTKVPASTPLTPITHQVYDWPSARRTVF